MSTLIQIMKPQFNYSSNYSSNFSVTVGGQNHAPASFTPGKETQCPMYRKLPGQ